VIGAGAGMQLSKNGGNLLIIVAFITETPAREQGPAGKTLPP